MKIYKIKKNRVMTFFKGKEQYNSQSKLTEGDIFIRTETIKNDIYQQVEWKIYIPKIKRIGYIEAERKKTREEFERIL